jgi:hypothetical protein
VIPGSVVSGLVWGILPAHWSAQRMLGQYQSLSTFFPHPSSPYPSRIFSPMWLKRLWKASAAHLPSGGMKDVPFPFVNPLNCTLRSVLSSLHKSELGKKTMLQRTGGNTRNKCNMGDYDMEKKSLTNLFYFNTCRLIHRCNEVARWPHGCRRQCSEVAVPALVGTNPTEGGGFFRRKETPPGHGCVCMSSRG